MQLEMAIPKGRLTPRQMQLLKAISSFQASRCYSPTIGEMASELSISRSTVFEHIVELRKKELLSGCQGRARSLQLTSKAQNLLNNLGDDSPTYSSQTSSGIELVGKVAAGLPIEAVENKEDLSLNSQFGNRDDIFALEVTGDSMIDENIRDGDFVICKRKSTANNGQLVVAAVDDSDATLKRFYKERDRVRLEPANDDYEPIYSDNCRIEAVVVGLLRKF